MSTIEIDPYDLDAAVDRLPDDQPVMMVNLLRFFVTADYSGTARSTEQFLPAVSGREAYLTRYLPAFATAMAPHGISELVFAGIVAAKVVGPTAAGWDAVAVASYPSIAAFRDLVNDPAYRENAAPHRLAALADWQLFATTPLAGS